MLPILINDVPVVCINQVSHYYHLDARLLVSILAKEGGKVGASTKNKNGTVDLGPMQINSSWLPYLAKYGYSRNDVQFNPCINFKIGAWILAKSLANGKTAWQGVGYYNSHTSKLNKIYYKSVQKFYFKIKNL